MKNFEFIGDVNIDKILTRESLPENYPEWCKKYQYWAFIWKEEGFSENQLESYLSKLCVDCVDKSSVFTIEVCGKLSAGFYRAANIYHNVDSLHMFLGLME